MKILGPPSSTLDIVLRGARRKNASPLFLDTIIPIEWRTALRLNVDPVGAIAQAARETGWGKWPGSAVLTSAWRNVAGLKVYDPAAFGLTGGTDYERFAHQIFPTWEQGVLAHIQHLVAYTGCLILPGDVVDPRYHLIVGAYRCVEFADLSGKWAGAADYGQQIERVARELTA